MPEDGILLTSFICLIVPAVLSPWGLLRLQPIKVPGAISGVKCGRCVRTTEIYEPIVSIKWSREHNTALRPPWPVTEIAFSFTLRSDDVGSLP
jgi:hypothetical protein